MLFDTRSIVFMNAFALLIGRLATVSANAQIDPVDSSVIRQLGFQGIRQMVCFLCYFQPPGVRRERCGFRGARHRRGGLQSRDPTGQNLVRVGLGSRAQRHLHLGMPVSTLASVPHANHMHHLAMSPEEFISRIMEAEPPEIYLMEDLKKPFTEASMMMTLTNLADKELVLMISWAKKIPGKIPNYPMVLSSLCGLHVLVCIPNIIWARQMVFWGISSQI